MSARLGGRALPVSLTMMQASASPTKAGPASSTVPCGLGAVAVRRVSNTTCASSSARRVSSADISSCIGAKNGRLGSRWCGPDASSARHPECRRIARSTLKNSSGRLCTRFAAPASSARNSSPSVCRFTSVTSCTVPPTRTGSAVLVAGHHPAQPQPGPLAAVVGQPDLDVDVRSAVEQRAVLLGERAHVVGVHEREERLRGRLGGGGVDAGEPVGLVRPRPGSGPQVAVPAPDPRQRLHVLELGVALVQLVEQRALLGVVLGPVEVAPQLAARRGPARS